jgi:hypothetical protein
MKAFVCKVKCSVRVRTTSTGIPGNHNESPDYQAGIFVSISFINNFFPAELKVFIHIFNLEQRFS